MIDMSLPKQGEPAPPSKLRRRRMRFVVLFVALGLLGLVIGMAGAWWFGRPPVTQPSAPATLPESVVSQAAFAAHVPAQLPTGYAYDPASAHIDEGALVYMVKNTAGHAIVFSEQVKPARATIDAFHRENILGARVIEGTAHESLLGDATTGGKILSIVTSSTWLLISGSGSTAEANLKAISYQIR